MGEGRKQQVFDGWKVDSIEPLALDILCTPTTNAKEYSLFKGKLYILQESLEQDKKRPRDSAAQGAARPLAGGALPPV